MITERVPFEWAITDKLLLKPHFDTCSLPQQTILKAFYGLELNDAELEQWAILQGMCEYDYLGYPTKVYPLPYTPKEYSQLWAILGRRSGKSDRLGATIIAYEALLGGHMAYVSEGQDVIIYNVAQKMGVAQSNLKFIASAVHKSKLLAKEMLEPTAEQIRFKNGIVVQASPPSLRGQRGLAVPVALMDEVGFWYSDPESANPDMAVEEAIRYAQIQFPNAKMVGISTPWTKEGLLWKYHQSGTEGVKLQPEEREQYKNILVVYAPTPAMQNPHIKRERLEQEYVKGADSYQRETLARFTDSISGFLNGKLVDKAIEKGTNSAEREYQRGNVYIAAIDPAFRQDSFAFAIVHRERNGEVVLDCIKRWTPLPGTRLNPIVVLKDIKSKLTEYNVFHLFSDQYQLESMQQLALQLGMSIEGIDFTSRSKAKIYGSLEKLLNTQRLTLLDASLNHDVKDLAEELKRLEKKLNAGGSVSIAAPTGMHDDLATVLALACFKSVWMLPEMVEEDEHKEPTIFELCMQSIHRKQAVAEVAGEFDW